MQALTDCSVILNEENGVNVARKMAHASSRSVGGLEDMGVEDVADRAQQDFGPEWFLAEGGFQHSTRPLHSATYKHPDLRPIAHELARNIFPFNTLIIERLYNDVLMS